MYIYIYVIYTVDCKLYCWWKKSFTTWDVSNPVNNGIHYQPQLGSRTSSINHIIDDSQYLWHTLLDLHRAVVEGWSSKEEHMLSCTLLWGLNKVLFLGCLKHEETRSCVLPTLNCIFNSRDLSTIDTKPSSKNDYCIDWSSWPPKMHQQSTKKNAGAPSSCMIPRCVKI